MVFLLAPRVVVPAGHVDDVNSSKDGFCLSCSPNAPKLISGASCSCLSVVVFIVQPADLMWPL